MTDITELSNNGEIEGQDLIPFYSQNNAVPRSVSFNVLKEAIPTIKSVTYNSPKLKIIMTNDVVFEVDIV